MSNEQHFRFLDLPKEIRLLVYEFLPIQTRHGMLLQPIVNEAIGSKVVTKTLPVAILATCKLVNNESSGIIAKKISGIVAACPRIIVGPHYDFDESTWFQYASREAMQAFSNMLACKIREGMDDDPGSASLKTVRADLVKVSKPVAFLGRHIILHKSIIGILNPIIEIGVPIKVGDSIFLGGFSGLEPSFFRFIVHVCRELNNIMDEEIRFRPKIVADSLLMQDEDAKARLFMSFDILSENYEWMLQSKDIIVEAEEVQEQWDESNMC